MFCKNKKYKNIKSEETEKIVEKLLRKKVRLKLGIVFKKKNIVHNLMLKIKIIHFLIFTIFTRII